MSRWKVRKVGDMWEAQDPLGEYTQSFLWWHVAMAYADEMARTIEVTLPRSRPCFAEILDAPTLNLGWRYRPERDTYTYRVIDLYNSSIELEHEDLKPLALALLAQHYRQDG